MGLTSLALGAARKKYAEREVKQAYEHGDVDTLADIEEYTSTYAEEFVDAVADSGTVTGAAKQIGKNPYKAAKAFGYQEGLSDVDVDDL